MAELDVLRELLVGELFVNLRPQYGNWLVDLRESNRQAKLKSVRIRDLPEGTVVLKVDKCKPYKSLFRDKHGPLRRCDYILFLRKEDRRLALFVELKSERLGRDRIIRQFKGAECLMDYCDAVLNRFHGKMGLLRHYEKHFVVFYISRLDKQTTRPKSAPKNDMPERFLTYANPSSKGISIKELIKF